MISSFDELLQAASSQDDAQRLLMLFAQAETTTKKHKSTQRGTVSPLMCVDKLPGEITSFEALVTEADGVNAEWDFVLIAGLSGEGHVPPSAEEAEPYLNQMTNDLTTGQNIAKYVVFDRSGNTLEMQAS